MTSSDQRGRPRGHPAAWSWSDARGFLFESTTAPDRLLTTDLGPDAPREDFQAWLMQKALRESCERVAQLLNEAGLSPEDVQHLDPNHGRQNMVADFLQEEP